MGYVQSLLRGKLDLHRDELTRFENLKDYKYKASCLGVIAELELAIKILKDSETFKYI